MLFNLKAQYLGQKNYTFRFMLTASLFELDNLIIFSYL